MQWPANDTPLRRVLDERNISARQLAADIGASHAMVAKLVSGGVHKRPKLSLIVAIAEHLDIDVETVVAAIEDGAS